jgi:ferritin-like metal-binding protein YciE
MACEYQALHVPRPTRDLRSKTKEPATVNYQEMMIKDLQDLYQSEMAQESELPQLASAATNEALRTALQDHATETQRQTMRLRQILEMIGETPGGNGQVTPGVHGLVSEAHKKSEQAQDPVLRDLALIAAAQKMEHYEMACYGTARAMARTAGMDEAAKLLQVTLNEEEAADKRLTDVALPIHKQAAQTDPTIPQ